MMRSRQAAVMLGNDIDEDGKTIDQAVSEAVLAAREPAAPKGLPPSTLEDPLGSLLHQAIG